MKEHYTIGEVSKIYNISVHSLRHYHKINLIVPSYIDESTGYRYYTFDQFHYISRLKYFRSIGLSLGQIRRVFESGDGSDFKAILQEIKEEKEKEIEGIKDIIDKIEWMDSYYSSSDISDMDNLIYKRHFPERYVFKTLDSEEKTIEEMDIALHSSLYSKKFRKLKYFRQYGYFMDYESLLNNVSDQISETMLLSVKPDMESPHISTLPEGDYICYCARILNESMDVSPLIKYIEAKHKTDPKVVIAFEYEEYLEDYYNAIYEIQLLF
ncbi:DNA-binding transcriptional regulator, MerR family [Dethiosulfatibacter aminovorans DSM 17477]|uniref:DNA-binding transcriptional regulator, MerR family n=1 Tax=Dethiosulfatibacter aminovorans DSM 17477 TaxID=1121476 RepID=A0A1M6JY88_9FIRM|nr:MerR family transcriptional regulator [Dethiosulfatibacter aminovorans]SHJ51646.1 DNA-binding transcriptional regulator, MerR family [Dethiosulfatibacter aminovorans DSM 17477]